MAVSQPGKISSPDHRGGEINGQGLLWWTFDFKRIKDLGLVVAEGRRQVDVTS